MSEVAKIVETNFVQYATRHEGNALQFEIQSWLWLQAQDYFNTKLQTTEALCKFQVIYIKQ